MKTEMELGVFYEIDWPWTDEDLDLINRVARRSGKVLVKTLNTEIIYEVEEDDTD